MTTASLHGLYCELYWGRELAEARSFGSELESIRAAPDELAPLPLYGFGLPEEGRVLAERTPQGGYRIFPPEGVAIFRQPQGGSPRRVETAPRPLDDGRHYVDLEDGTTLTLVILEKDLRLNLRPSVVDQRVGAGPRRGMWALAVALIAGLTFPIAFLAGGPDMEEMARQQARALDAFREREEAQRRAIQEAYPSHVDPDAPPVKPEDGITLPSSFSVH